jgi:hypothetical protein
MLLVKNIRIAKAVNSSITETSLNLLPLSEVSTTKHNPSKVAEVLRMCGKFPCFSLALQPGNDFGIVGTTCGLTTFTSLPDSSIRYFWKFHSTSESCNPFLDFWVRNWYIGAVVLPLTSTLLIMGKVTP